MRLNKTNMLSLGVLLALVLSGWAMLASNDAVAGGGRGGKPAACCDPDAEPGVGGNPFCFEGHSCCSDGQWRCNNADGSPSCAPGAVCPEGCGQRNDPCSADDDCCSGQCKSNGRCK
ncbi:MAG: hypothetical protein V3W34_05885 [Phycisphaerae bacterium]